MNLNGSTERSREQGSSLTSSNSDHAVMPEVQWGKFTNSTTMIGLGAKYGFTWNGYKSGTGTGPNLASKSRTISQSVALLPFIRKYKPLGERWAVFLHAEAGPTYNWYNVKYSGTGYDPNNGSYWQFDLGIRPGVVYFFPKKSFAIEGYANVLSLTASYSNLPNDNGRQIRLVTGLSTDFPSYFTIRLAKYLPLKTI